MKVDDVSHVKAVTDAAIEGQRPRRSAALTGFRAPVVVIKVSIAPQ
jgi:hypothetical protein